MRGGLRGRPFINGGGGCFTGCTRCSREAGQGLQLLRVEVELQEKLLGLLIPVNPELAPGLVALSAWHLEGDGLLELGSHQQVLPVQVLGLDLILPDQEGSRQ